MRSEKEQERIDFGETGRGKDYGRVTVAYDGPEFCEKNKNWLRYRPDGVRVTVVCDVAHRRTPSGALYGTVAAARWKSNSVKQNDLL